MSVRPHGPRRPRPLDLGEPDDSDELTAFDELGPLAGQDLEDSWEPPDPALAGPWQLLAALVGVIAAGLALLATLAAVSWLFRGG